MPEKEPVMDQRASVKQKYTEWIDSARRGKIQLEKSLKIQEVLLERMKDMREECEGLLKILGVNPILAEDNAVLAQTMKDKIVVFKKDEAETRLEIEYTRKLIQEGEEIIADLESGRVSMEE